MTLPYQIQQMREQIGLGLKGGFVYVGASQLTYTCKHATGGAVSVILPNGLIDAPVSLSFRVNGKRNEHWRFFVSVEPSDTYKVYLWRKAKISTKKACQLMAEGKPVPAGEILDSAEDVYCDSLQECIEQMYDKAIKTHNQGFIPL